MILQVVLIVYIQREYSNELEALPESLLRQSLKLCNDVIFSGHLKMYLAEDQMHMEPGGIARMCLRAGKYKIHFLSL